MQTIIRYSQLALWQELDAAACEPMTADLIQLWQKLEQTIRESDLERYQKLVLAGEAISQIFQVYVLRAHKILDGLEIKDSNQGPILSEDFLDGLMRQSMSIDLSNLMENLFPKEEVPESQPEITSGPMATLIDKQTSRAMARQARIDASKEVEALAEQESVSEWTRAITIWTQQHCSSQAVSLVELQQALGMPLVEVWLGLLLGGEYELQQSGEFYDPKGIQVAQHSPVSQAGAGSAVSSR